MFSKSVGEFTVSVSDPFPYWITIEHEFCDAAIKYHFEELPDLIYALQRAEAAITEDRARAVLRGLPPSHPQQDQEVKK